MSKRFFLGTALLFFTSMGFAREWWQRWDNFPKVPKISAQMAKDLLLSGRKVLLVYSGYEVNEVVCGSIIIPYTLVPPNADGSRINLSGIPKDYWILCYCP